MYALNGSEQATDSPAKLIDGSTMVPVRLLSKVLGAKIGYSNRDNQLLMEKAAWPPS